MIPYAPSKNYYLFQRIISLSHNELVVAHGPYKKEANDTSPKVSQAINYESHNN